MTGNTKHSPLKRTSSQLPCQILLLWQPSEIKKMKILNMFPTDKETRK